MTYLKFSCPICKGQRVLQGYNDLATTRPDIAMEWDFDANGDLLPTMVTKGSKKMVNWVCHRGHKWVARVSARDYSNEGCPECANYSSTSKGEQFLYKYVKQAFVGYEVLNRHKIDGIEFDVVVPSMKLVFEFDGSYWHSLHSTTYKDEFAKNNGYTLWKVIESDHNEVIGNDYYF